MLKVIFFKKTLFHFDILTSFWRFGMNTHILPSGIAILYNQLRSITSKYKLQRTAGNIAFTVKCNKLHLTSTFATVKGNFYNEQDRFSASKKKKNLFKKPFFPF